MLAHWKPRKTTCFTCGKETNNPYSKRGGDGIERQYCFKCVKKSNSPDFIQLTLF